MHANLYDNHASDVEAIASQVRQLVWFAQRLIATCAITSGCHAAALRPSPMAQPPA
jgi:hypothetical protein